MPPLSPPPRTPAELSPPARNSLAKVRLFALDVDGVLTDGRIVYSGDGEIQNFDVHDGQGIAWLLREGVHVAWITGRGCRATERRAAELGVRELHVGATDKAAVLRGVQERLLISVEETAAMGDDLADLGMGSRAGFFAAPPSARAEVLARADLVTRSTAGAGAVREVAEHILRAKGLWPAIARSLGG